ncbi:MAG: hypothetical protein GVY13_18185 [Alphaproteobacteria bacterium]|jgi:inner membrane protein involved in colicin E2 resistance|nr:hypothetical protein [Alphaproteobacteria bacterium]
MTGILQYDTAHGTISIEVDEGTAAAQQGHARAAATGIEVKGDHGPKRTEAGDVIAKASGTFDQAMESLRAYAGSLADMIEGLDLTPEEVSIDVGLKMTGSAGFIIAKAGAETEMKVSLTWKPRKTSASGGQTG